MFYLKKKISRIRTGGQSGADRAAMDFAKETGIPLCGWCPKNGWAEDYPDPLGLLADYPELTETPSEGTEQRTKWNMREAMRKARRHACMSDRLTNAVTPSTKYEVTGLRRDSDDHTGWRPAFTGNGCRPERRRNPA